MKKDGFLINMSLKKNSKTKNGFTLIELLIVIAIIAILAAIIFVALDPLKRFQDSRDAARWSNVSFLLSAIKIDQIDNGGYYLPEISGLTDNAVYMIGSASAGCANQNAYCDINVGGNGLCVDLSGLVTEGYLGSVPVSPNGDGSWSTSTTGYTLEKRSTGIVTIRSCESENTDEIYLIR